MCHVNYCLLNAQQEWVHLYLCYSHSVRPTTSRTKGSLAGVSMKPDAIRLFMLSGSRHRSRTDRLVIWQNPTPTSLPKWSKNIEAPRKVSCTNPDFRRGIWKKNVQIVGAKLLNWKHGASGHTQQMYNLWKWTSTSSSCVAISISLYEWYAEQKIRSINGNGRKILLTSWCMCEAETSVELLRRRPAGRHLCTRCAPIYMVKKKMFTCDSF